MLYVQTVRKRIRSITKIDSRPVSSKSTMSRTSSLSSLDSTPSSNLFQQINNLFDTIRYEATSLRNNMKTYGKRISHTTLAEKVFEPKPQHVAWFQTAVIQTPCTISTFLTAILAMMAAESRIDKQERSVVLTEAEAALFELSAGTHKWTEVLEHLPSVFL